ncbi:MAG: phosphopyruvate hydratase, partial [Clostridia bacterium]|nr:phosphopyruvate hydratase [Clostridia bacterium]
MTVTAKPIIQKCIAREILDSRGNPTVEAAVYLEDGSIGVASAPSGASTGEFEAHEKRDENRKRYRGKGVLETAARVQEELSPALRGLKASDQGLIDRTLRNLDGTEEKSNYGANVLLALSMASARAAANYYHISLYRYLGGIQATRLPVPMMNVLNGGAHASNNLEIQEFMIVPFGASCFSEALRMGSEVYHALHGILVSRGHVTAVGDEGGFAPNLASDEEALDLLMEAIQSAGYDETKIGLAIDAAASEWHEDGDTYRMPKRGKMRQTSELIDYWKHLVAKYPILSIEDGLDENDFSGWSTLTKEIGDRVMLVGDDLFVTN